MCKGNSRLLEGRVGTISAWYAAQQEKARSQYYMQCVKLAADGKGCLKPPTPLPATATHPTKVSDGEGVSAHKLTCV